MLSGLIAAFVVFTGAHKVYTAPLSEAYIRERVVKIMDKNGFKCTGEQVRAPSGKDYILTAAHCKGDKKPGDEMLILDSKDKLTFVKVLEEDDKSDLLLLEGLPNLKGLPIAIKPHKKGDHIRTFTHGQGLDTFKTEGEVIERRLLDVPFFEILSFDDLNECQGQKYMVAPTLTFDNRIAMVCNLFTSLLITSAKAYPGSSGGPAVNDAGELMGVVSSYFVDSKFSMLTDELEINRFLKNR